MFAPAFLLGKSEATGREAVLFFGPDGSLMSGQVAQHQSGAARDAAGRRQPSVSALGGGRKATCVPASEH